MEKYTEMYRDRDRDSMRTYLVIETRAGAETRTGNEAWRRVDRIRGRDRDKYMGGENGNGARDKAWEMK